MKKTCISKAGVAERSRHERMDKRRPPERLLDNTAEKPRRARRSVNGFFVGGEGTYVKELDIPAEPKHYILDIDGAYMYARVSLGNFLLAKHPHGYTPFLVDLTPRVRFGETNKLTIRTDDCQQSTRWYTGAGIYRDVYLYEGGGYPY